MALLCGPVAADGLPTRGTVAHGKVSIAKPTRNRMQIRQGSKAAIVNWNGFSIGRGGRVDIVQPSKKAAILNRVTGKTRSSIRGRLSANGQVYLVNPNGIEITRSGKVRADAFVASTLDISDRDFREGRKHFAGGVAAPASVSNAGLVEARSYAALLGGKVENSGMVSAEVGSVGLGAGRRATLKLSGDFLQVALPPSDGALVDSSGVLRGGRVEIRAAAARQAARQAVNLSGVVEARSAKKRGGTIVISGDGGEVAVSGRLDASASRGKGGVIEATGDRIRLAGARIDASGPEGGGKVIIGGGLRGEGPLPRSRLTGVDAATVISADATRSGDGGAVVLWSDVHTGFAGSVTARGGPKGGDGGFAEVSGKRLLSFTGTADLSAARGAFGTLLLDPSNIVISDEPTAGIDASLDGTWFLSPDADSANSVLNATNLETLLGAANVDVTTANDQFEEAGNITVVAPLAWATANTLDLDADGNIDFQNTVEAPAGGLTATADGAITTQAAAAIEVAALQLSAAGNIGIGGQLTLGTGAITSEGTASVTGPGATFASLTIGGAGGVSLAAPMDGGADGDLTVTSDASIATTAAGPITVDTLSWAAGVDVAVGGQVTAATGRIDAGGSLSIAGDGVDLGTFTLASASDVQIAAPVTGGDVTIIAGGDGNINTTAAGSIEVDTLTLNAGDAISAEGAVDVGLLLLQSGDWTQIATPLPAFEADDFQISDGTATFLRVLEGNGDNLPYVLADIYGVQGVSGFPNQNFTVGNDIDAAVTEGWNPGEEGGFFGFVPIATFDDSGVPIPFSAVFDGAGFTISELFINRPDTEQVGLFAALGDGAEISDLALTAVDVTGGPITGGLTGQIEEGASMEGVSIEGVVIGQDPGFDTPVTVGGIAGVNSGSIADAVSTAAVTANGGFGEAGATTTQAGGLVGDNAGSIEGSTASGAVLADGAGDAIAWAGGLVGESTGTITASSATGEATATSGDGGTALAGGLAGGSAGAITASFATGDVSGSAAIDAAEGATVAVGGLLGLNTAEISDSFATGDVSGEGEGVSVLAGGLVGATDGGDLVRVFASGAVEIAAGAAEASAGGLVGDNSGTIADAYALGAVTAEGGAVGGLVGENSGTIDRTYAVGAVSDGGDGAGGLVGLNDDGAVAGSFWDVDTSGTGFSDGGAGLSTAEFQDTAAFAAEAEDLGWSFEVWSPSSAGFYPEIYTINPVIRVDPNDADRQYGIANTAFTVAQSFGGPGVFVFGPDGDTAPDVVGTLSSAADETSDIGDYDILAAGTVVSPLGQTYRVTTLEPGTLTVTPAPLTIVADDGTKVYGNVFDFDGHGFTVTGLFNDDTVSGVTFESEGAPATAVVGEDYAITVTSWEGTGLGNYDVNLGDNVPTGTLTVTPAPLTITVGDDSKVYGETYDLDDVEFTVAGLLNDDTVDSVTFTSLGAPGTAEVGDYAINAVVDSVDGQGIDNYFLAPSPPTPGTLTVTPAPLTITVGDDSKVYGETYDLGDVEFTVAGLLNDDTVDSVSFTSLGAPGTAEVDDYDVNVVVDSLDGQGIANYFLAPNPPTPGTLTVTPAPLTITADDQSKPFGDRLTFLGDEFDVAGLRNADRVDLATLTSDGARAGARIGDYAIDIGAARGVGLENYDIDYRPGTLEVAPRVPTPKTNLVTLIPEIAGTLPNPPDVIDIAFATGVAAGGGAASGGRPPEPLDARRLHGAEDMLGYLQSASSRLEAEAEACRQTVTDAQTYLACLGVALDSYAAAIDARLLDLPPPLRAVAATIREASQALSAARATAARRLAGAGSEAEAAAIEREAIETARAAIESAAREVRAAITLLRADEPQLASIEAAQGEEIAQALDAVADGLVRAVGL